MKWDTIKDRVAAGVRHEIRCMAGDTAANIMLDLLSSDFAAIRAMRVELRDARFHDAAERYAAEAEKVIDAWDIRAIGRLRDLFPGHFPRSLRKGNLVAFYDEEGDWAVQVAA